MFRLPCTSLAKRRLCNAVCVPAILVLNLLSAARLATSDSSSPSSAPVNGGVAIHLSFCAPSWHTLGQICAATLAGLSETFLT